MPKGSPFYGLGLKEAAPRQLQLYGNPQTPREIWEVLHSTGYQTAHGDPVSAVRSALRRRAKTHGDVLLVGEGKWGRKEWYSEEQLEEIQKSVGGMGGRDRASHSAATTRGMLVARARGARLGAQKKLSEEKLAEVEEMIRAGNPLYKVAKAFGVTPATIYNNIPRERIANLREEAQKLKSEGVPPEEVRH